jgi:hypothetical protein
VAVASGVVDTDAILADEKVVDMQNQFRLLDPDSEQFFKLLSKLPSQEAKREKVNWLEDQYFPNLSALAASATSAATTLDVTAGQGDYFRAGDLVPSPTLVRSWKCLRWRRTPSRSFGPSVRSQRTRRSRPSNSSSSATCRRRAQTTVR